MQSRIGGHIRSRYVVPAPDCKMRAKHLRQLDTILRRKIVFLGTNQYAYNKNTKVYNQTHNLFYKTQIVTLFLKIKIQILFRLIKYIF